jgi:hypothetical protein
VGSDSDQEITVEGENFQDGAFVILDDTEDSEGQFENPEKTEFVSSTELIRSATFTENAAEWRARVENPDGQQSDWVYFDVEAPSEKPHVTGPSEQIRPDPDRQYITFLGTNFASDVEIDLREEATDVVHEIPSERTDRLSSTKVKVFAGVGTEEGTWSVRATNPSSGKQSDWVSFDVNYESDLSTLDVLAPVKGSFRVTGTENPECANDQELWTFCQHQTLYHRPGGGVADADGTLAYDMNLIGDADDGNPVFAAAPGTVVPYGGQYAPGEVSGSVLIEHNTDGETWWTGYVHMENINLKVGQEVTTDTQLGTISDVCDGCDGKTIPNHLHFAAYIGTNTVGGLRSSNVEFNKRTSSGGGDSPDLVFSEPVSVTPTTVEARGTIDIDFTVKNEGKQTSDQSKLRVWLNSSSDPDDVSKQDYKLDERDIDALSENETQSYAINDKVIPDLDAGTYYVWAVLDVNSSAGQVNEDNDFSKQQIEVKNPTSPPSNSICPENIDFSEQPQNEEIAGCIQKLSKEYNVPPIVVAAISWQESDWRQFVNGQPYENSTTGAVGLMQIVPTDDNITFDKEKIRTNWKYNLEIGIRILKEAKFSKYSLDSASPYDSKFDTNWNVIENWFYPIAWYNGSGEAASGFTAYNYVAEIYSHISKLTVPLSKYFESIPKIGNPTLLPDFPQKIYENIPFPKGSLDPISEATCRELISHGMYTLQILIESGQKIHRWDSNNTEYEEISSLIPQDGAPCKFEQKVALSSGINGLSIPVKTTKTFEELAQQQVAKSQSGKSVAGSLFEYIFWLDEEGTVRYGHISEVVPEPKRGYFVFVEGEEPISFTYSGTPVEPELSLHRTMNMSGVTAQSTFEQNSQVFDSAFYIKNNESGEAEVLAVNFQNESLDPGTGYFLAANEQTIFRPATGSSPAKSKSRSVTNNQADKAHREQVESVIRRVNARLADLRNSSEHKQREKASKTATSSTSSEVCNSNSEYALKICLEITQEKVSDKLSTRKLAAATHPDATGDWEEDLDELQAISTPGEVHAYFDKGYGLSRSVKSTNFSEKNWLLLVTSASKLPTGEDNTNPVNISWTIDKLPEGKNLQLLDNNGNVIVEDMTGETSHQLDMSEPSTKNRFRIRMSSGSDDTGGDGPDLVIEDASVTPAEVSPGDEVEISYILANRGNRDANDYIDESVVVWEIAHYLSEDGNFDDEDIRLGDEKQHGPASSFLMPRREPNWTDDIDEDEEIPGDIEPGVYNILIVADEESEVQESNEGNNIEPVRLIIANPIPAIPTGLTFYPDGNSVDLSWNANSETDLAGYNLYRGLEPGSLSLLQNISQPQTSYTDSDISDSKTYYYAVSAVDDDGNESTLSGWVSYIHDQLTITDDWQLVSSPAKESKNLTGVTTYGFDGAYHSDNALSAGKGYWVRSNSEETVSFRDEGMDEIEIQLQEGWNLIGSLVSALNESAITDTENIIGSPPIYGYSIQNGYESATELQPKQGYWLYAEQDGIITLSLDTEASANPAKTIEVEKSEGDILTFSNQTTDQELYYFPNTVNEETRKQYLLPPVAPESALDVRTKNGYKAMDASNDLKLTSQTYPVNIQLKSSGEGLYAYRIIAENNNDNKELTLTSGSPVQLQEEVERIQIEQLLEEEVILEDALDPNYPNPFNNSTTIRYKLAQTSQIHLDVYDLTGRKVKTLIDARQTSGEYARRFNTNGLASGVYFIRLQVNNKVLNQKISLIK